MSKKANPASIGLFLVLGLVLAVAGVFIFSSGHLFRSEEKFILYFDASLKGLEPGAPVKIRGVTVGKVQEVLIRHNQASNDFAMPVIIVIDTRLAQTKSDEDLQLMSKTRLDLIIREGFRAHLDAESLVTGVLYVALDIVSNSQAPVFHQITPEYPEIPTKPSEIQHLLAELSEVDIRGIAEKLNTLLARVDTTLKQFDVPAINEGLTNLLGSADRVVSAPDLTNSFTALRQTLDRASVLVNRIDGRVDPLADGVTDTLRDARKTLAELQVAVGNVSELLSPDSAVRPDLRQALEELGRACRSVADLAEFLERNPNALLIGKKPTKERP